MRRPTAAVLTIVGAAAVLALGFAVAALANPNGTAGSATGTSETATTPTSTTEQAQTSHYGATLTARAEVPRPKGTKAGAGGTFTINLTHKGGGYSATWKLTFHTLTGKATAAHIHEAKPGKAGPVLVPLCGPCKSVTSGAIKNVAEMDVSAIKTGKAYVNVHTAKNPAGEIRGQIAKR